MLINPDDYIAKMTLEEKVGQLLLVTIPQKRLDPQWEKHLKEHLFAGIIFSRKSLDNEVQTRALIDEVQELYSGIGTGMPSFVTIQQEGGVADSLLFGKVVSPGNMAIGATRNSDYAYQAAKLSAEELKSYGFNLVLAPVLDVNSTFQNPRIGARSFAEDIDLTAQMGVKAVRGYQENGLACCARHFPGIGSMTEDPSQTLPVMTLTENLMLEEMKPFKQAVKSGRVECIMTGHVSYPYVVRDGKPATLSRALLGFYLRDKLNFKNIIISDVMEMGAILSTHTIEEAVLLALDAGVDLIQVGADKDNQVKVFNAVKEAVESGYISEERLNESLSRIIRQKHRRSQMRSPMREDPIPMMMEIARASVTLAKNEGGILPFKLSEEEYIGIIHPEFPHHEMPTLGEVLSNRYPWVDEISYNINDEDLDWDDLVERMSGCSVIIYVSYNHGLIPHHQLEWIEKIRAIGKPLIGIGMNNPYHLAQFDKDVKGALLTYSGSHYSLEALTEVLLGEIKPEGLLPVNISDAYPLGFSLTY